MTATEQIDRAAITKVLGLWQAEFPDFTPTQRDQLLRWNGPFVTGLEFKFNREFNDYHIRVFVHAFRHEECDAIYYEATKDFHYSFARHGIGLKYIGIAEPFAEFCTQLRRESIAIKAPSLADVERFLGESHAQWSHVSLACAAFIVFLRSGYEAAAEWLEKRNSAFDTFDPATQALLGGSWPTWRGKILLQFSVASIRRKQKLFFSHHGRARMVDRGVTGCSTAGTP